MANYIIPVIFLTIFVYAIVKKIPLYGCFTDGIKSALRLIADIFPFITAIFIAVELLNDPTIGDKYTEREKDLMILSLVLHDGLKYGNPKEQYTRADHPLIASEYVKNRKDELSFSEEDVQFVYDVIASHMGPWNQHPYTKEEILPKPKTRYQNFVHMCDYLASRKCILLEFDDNNDVIG